MWEQGNRDWPGVVEVGVKGEGVEREESLVDEGEEEGSCWGLWVIWDWGRWVVRERERGQRQGLLGLQTTQPTSGRAVTADSSCCANCVEPPRPQQWGPDLPFVGMPAMRTRWMAGAAAHNSG